LEADFLAAALHDLEYSEEVGLQCPLHSSPDPIVFRSVIPFKRGSSCSEPHEDGCLLVVDVRWYRNKYFGCT
jgi:hypothetical protein